MSDIEYRRIAADEVRIHCDGRCAGEVFLHADITRPDAPTVYIVHLESDPRGPHRVCERGQVRDAVRRLLDTHPLF